MRRATSPESHDPQIHPPRFPSHRAGVGPVVGLRRLVGSHTARWCRCLRVRRRCSIRSDRRLANRDTRSATGRCRHRRGFPQMVVHTTRFRGRTAPGIRSRDNRRWRETRHRPPRAHRPADSGKPGTSHRRGPQLRPMGIPACRDSGPRRKTVQHGGGLHLLSGLRQRPPPAAPHARVHCRAFHTRRPKSQNICFRNPPRTHEQTATAGPRHRPRRHCGPAPGNPPAARR